MFHYPENRNNFNYIKIKYKLFVYILTSRRYIVNDLKKIKQIFLNENESEAAEISTKFCDRSLQYSRKNCYIIPTGWFRKENTECAEF